MNYDLVFQSKQGPICSYNILKIPKVKKKNTLDLSKSKFQNGLKPKTYIFGYFLRQTATLQPNPQKMCQNIFADSERCIKYGDLST